MAAADLTQNGLERFEVPAILSGRSRCKDLSIHRARFPNYGR